MVILGIDPGIATVGFGVLKMEHGQFSPVDYGAILTPAHTPLEQRLHTIYDDLCELIVQHRPDAISVEELFFNTNQKTAIHVAHARGVILLAAAKTGVPFFEYTPLQVKMAVVGYGRADKNQIQQMVKTLLRLSVIPKPDDTADALALAICHGHTAGSKLFA